MVKVNIDYQDRVRETIAIMDQMGLLLVSADSNGKPNVMTIGWGNIGVIWKRPIFTVLVRQSRFTHHLLEDCGEFTVNAPSPNLKAAVEDCGVRSGRDIDKFAVHGFTATPGRKVQVPIIEQCIGHYECKIVYKTQMDKTLLNKSLDEDCYPKGDYHTIYFGEIKEVYWKR